MANTDFTARCMAGKALDAVAGKQDVIADLDTIRAGAAAGATAVQPATLENYQPKIDSTHKLDADLVDDTNSTNKFATQSELDQIELNKNNISSIFPTAYNAVEVETGAPITILGGGYVRIGNLVCINLKISVTGTISQADPLIKGLPKPILEYNTGFGAVSLTNNIGRVFNVIGTGSIAYGDATSISSGTVILSGMYIAHE